MAIKQYSAFTPPSPYDQERRRAEQMRQYAELLQQQAMSQDEQPFTYQGFRAAPSPLTALTKMLQAYGAKKAGEKADEAEARKTGMEEQAAQQIMGRLTGAESLFGRDQEGGMTSVYEPIEKQRAQIDADIERQRASGQLEEVRPTAQYTRDPMGAAQIATTGAGAGAMRGNPMLAAMLQKSMEEPKKKETRLNPKDFTPESWKQYAASDYKDDTLLRSWETTLTPQQRADIGLKAGQFTYETGMTPPIYPAPSATGAAPTTTAPSPARTAAALTATVPPATGAGRLPPKARQELESQLLKDNLESTKAQLESAQKASQGLEKTYKALDLLEQGKPITGAGADIRLMGERLQSLFTGQPSAQVTDSQLLDALLGSDVFGYIQSLGVGSRGLDTPSERDFLLSVMTGTRKLDNETLKEMTKLRAKVLENNLDAVNERINAGDLDWYYELQAPYGVRKRPFKRPTRQPPAGTNPIRSQADAILRGEQ